MKNSFLISKVAILLFLLVGSGVLPQLSSAQVNQLSKLSDDGFNFILATDLGRLGRYDQKKVAETMGEVAGECDAEFVIAQGDTFHYMGVQSTQDPLFRSNYEDIYSHPELQIPWYPILGNHEYRGSTQAVIDYSKVSRRWEMPARYYKKSFKTDDEVTLDIFFIDTAPLIDKYRDGKDEYPDAHLQSREEQLAWLDYSLAMSKADFKVVVGHHPMYAQTSKADTEREQMQKYVDPIIKKYDVDLYTSGHIHNHQHFKVPGSNTDYLVVSSGSLSRKVKPMEHTVFSSSETGFAFVSIVKNTMTVYLLDSAGNILHSFSRNK